MTTKDEALKMAIEFIHKSQFESGGNYYVNRDKTIQACKEALQAEDIWNMLEDMSVNKPDEYTNFVQEQFTNSKNVQENSNGKIQYVFI